VTGQQRGNTVTERGKGAQGNLFNLTGELGQIKHRGNDHQRKEPGNRKTGNGRYLTSECHMGNMYDETQKVGSLKGKKNEGGTSEAR